MNSKIATYDWKIWPSFLIYLIFFHFLFSLFLFLQDDGLPENEHQLSVAGKIKKHFNTGPKPNSTAAGVSVIAVSIWNIHL